MQSGETCGRTIVAGVGVALLVTGLLSYLPGKALADPGSYIFTVLAHLSGPAPGGGTFDIDFEPWSVNDSSNVAFVADLKSAGTDIGEGVFASRQGQLVQIMRAGQSAPGGGTFTSVAGCCALGHTPLNSAGDGAFAYSLEPLDPHLGVNAGLYRFSLLAPTPTAVVVPDVTAAPTGGEFVGVFFDTSLNNRGDLMFGGIAPGLQQTGCVPGPCPGLDGAAVGVFKADKANNIIGVVIPGDPAPNGGVFDEADHGWINDRGEIAFEAHVKGEECIPVNPPFVCGGSVYKRLAKGQIQSIAHQGDPVPVSARGGTYRLAFGPVMNSSGDLIFIGDLTPPTPPPGQGKDRGVFLFDAQTGATTAVVRPGDPLPGGGSFANAFSFPYLYGLNNGGDVSLVGRLNTGATGLYASSHGKLQLVARTGTVIPGLGTIDSIDGGGSLNDPGRILFTATVAGQGMLLLATPRGSQ